MRMVTTYLEKAILFQQVAAEDNHPKLNANLHGLAEANEGGGASSGSISISEMASRWNDGRDGHETANYQTPW